MGHAGEVLEVLEGGVATTPFQIADERRPVGRSEHEVGIADHDVMVGIASMLGEGRRSGRQETPGEPGGESDPRFGDLTASFAEDLQRLGKVAHLDADPFQQQVGIGLDQG